MGDDTLHIPLLVWVHQFAMYDQKILFLCGLCAMHLKNVLEQVDVMAVLS
jgi:flavorubredoxin